MKIDLTDVEAWRGGVILPPGEYTVQVDDATEETSSGGNPQIKLEMRAIGGEQDGGTISDWVTVIPKTLGRVKQVLEAMGVQNLDGQVSFEAAELIGKKCRIVVRDELYNGETKTKVKAYTAVGAATNGTASSAVKDDSEKLAF
jgi:Protein of unknown function (DUF669)